MVERKLSGVRVACIALDGVEESELTEPVKALREAGAEVDLISVNPGTIQAFQHMDKGAELTVDRTIDDLNVDDYQSLLLPGGALNADKARMHAGIQDFVRRLEEGGRPIAAICHAPWILVSAGLVRGRTLTGYESIRDDIQNAGGNWVDEAVVVDGNWVTSRKPADIPLFNREMLRVFLDFEERKLAS
jgi:protease I